MTKYIVHGGMTTWENDLNKKFYSMIGDSLELGDKLLLCYFAPAEHGDLSERNRFKCGVELFKKNISKKEINFIFATRENFIEQIREVDAVYIHGGGTDELFATLKKYPNFVEEVKKKKLVVGSSAGAYILAKYSIDSAEGNLPKEKFGILPIKVTAHFKEEKRADFEEKLKAVDPEGKYENVFLLDCEPRSFSL